MSSPHPWFSPTTTSLLTDVRPLLDAITVLGFPQPLTLVHQPIYSVDWDTYVATVILPDGAKATVVSHSRNGPWTLVVPFVRDYH